MCRRAGEGDLELDEGEEVGGMGKGEGGGGGGENGAWWTVGGGLGGIGDSRRRYRSLSLLPSPLPC